MSRIAQDLGEIFVPGITVWREGNMEVVEYKVSGHTEEKKVWGVMEHRSPLQTAFTGFFDTLDEAVKDAEKGL